MAMEVLHLRPSQRFPIHPLAHQAEVEEVERLPNLLDQLQRAMLSGSITRFSVLARDAPLNGSSSKVLQIRTLVQEAVSETTTRGATIGSPGMAIPLMVMPQAP